MKLNKDLFQLFRELRKRGVIRAVSLYTVTAAGIIQILKAVEDHLNISPGFITNVIFLSIIFIPVVIYLSWKYDIVAEIKMKKDEGDEESESDWEQSKQPLTIMGLLKLIVPLVLGFTLLIWVSANRLSGSSNSIEDIRKAPIHVLKFANNTGIDSLDHIGHIASSDIANALHEVAEADVNHLTFDFGADINEALFRSWGFSDEFADATESKNVIEGFFTLEKNQLAFTCAIKESHSGRLLKPFETQIAPLDDPRQGIVPLVQQILGFWVTLDDPLFAGDPPRQDVLEEYIKAIKLWEKDYNKAIEHLDKCLQIDSTFYRAAILKGKVQSFRYQDVDSLLMWLNSKELQMNDIEKNQLRYLNAYVNGNNPLAFSYTMNEYALSPKDLYVNSTALTQAILYVNRPREAVKIAEELGRSTVDFIEYPFCLSRIQIHARALIDLGRYEEAIELVNSVVTDPVKTGLKDIEIRAYVRAGLINEVEEIIENTKFEKFTPARDHIYFTSTAASEFALVQNWDEVEKYSQIVIDAYRDDNRSQSLDTRLGRIYLIKGNYSLAEEHFKRGGSRSAYFQANLACALGYQDKRSEALSMIEDIRDRKPKNDYGWTAYYEAQVYNSLGDTTQAINALRQAIREGMTFQRYLFHYDPLFTDISSDQRFKELIGI